MLKWSSIIIILARCTSPVIWIPAASYFFGSDLATLRLKIILSTHQLSTMYA